MLEIFNLYYFLWVILFFIILFSTFYLLRNKSDKFKFWFLFSLSVLAWVVHFSRIWLEPNLRTHELFFVDLCGFSTMIYPFLILGKNKVAKDYMYYVGGVFAAHSLFYPNNILGQGILEYDTIRFFFAHTILVMIPLLFAMWKLQKPNIKHIPYMILFVLLGALYNVTISSIFYQTGLTGTLINYMGLWGNTDSVYRLFESVAPFFRYTTIERGIEVSKPIPYLYMIPGFILFYTPTWVLMSLPFMNLKRRKNS